MKRRGYLLVCLLLAAGLMLGGCMQEVPTVEPEAPKPMAIGIYLPGEDEGYTLQIQEGIKAYALAAQLPEPEVYHVAGVPIDMDVVVTRSEYAQELQSCTAEMLYIDTQLYPTELLGEEISRALLADRQARKATAESLLWIGCNTQTPWEEQLHKDITNMLGAQQSQVYTADNDAGLEEFLAQSKTDVIVAADSTCAAWVQAALIAQGRQDEVSVFCMQYGIEVEQGIRQGLIYGMLLRDGDKTGWLAMQQIQCADAPTGGWLLVNRSNLDSAEACRLYR